MTKIHKIAQDLILRVKAFALLAVLFAGSLLFPVSVFADSSTGEVKSFSFSPSILGSSVVRVTSSDGKKWDTFKTDMVKTRIKLDIDIKWPGYTKYVAMYLGDCKANTPCVGNGFSVPWDAAIAVRNIKDFDVQPVILKTNDDFVNTTISPGGPTYRKAILDTCNTFGLQNDLPTKEFSFAYDLALTAGAVIKKKWGNINLNLDAALEGTTPNPTHVKSGVVKITVVCEPSEKPVPKTTAVTLAPLKVDYLKVFLSTFSNAMTQPKAGVQCQKGRALMRVRTNRLGPVKLKLESRVGNEPLTLDIFETFAKLNKNGVPEAEIKKWFTTTKSSVLKTKLSTIDPAGTSTEWKELPLNCSAPGGGGWAQPDDSPVVDNTANEATPTDIPAAIKGELVLVDSSKTGLGIARQGRAILKMSSKEDQVQQYTLRCSGDRRWSGKIEPVKMQGGQYGYAQTHIFPIKKTELVKCVLRAISAKRSLVLDTKERLYTVVKPGSSSPGIGTMKPKEGPLTIESVVELRDNSAKAPYKAPRNGLVKIRAMSNKAGKVSYNLSCGLGRKWVGELTLKKKSLDKYAKSRSLSFPVKKTMLVQCVLQVTAKTGASANSTTQRQYQVLEGLGEK